jgi:Fe-S-cluster-containing hydrogenase component 2
MARLLLKFTDKIVEKPITAQVILDHKALIGIVAAHIDSQGGEILLDVPHTHTEEIAEAFRKKGVTVTVPNLIKVDQEKCFECGGCVSICPVNAITFKEDYSVIFNQEQCVGSTCSLCINACPARAIILVE